MENPIDLVEHLMQSSVIKTTEQDLKKLITPAHLAFAKFIIENTLPPDLTKKGEEVLGKYTATLDEVKLFISEATAILNKTQGDLKTANNAVIEASKLPKDLGLPNAASAANPR